MTAKTKAQVTVTFTGSEPGFNPDPVPVSRASNDGVIWTAATPGYTFTGINITEGDHTDFGTPVIGTNPAGQSTMSVTDSVSDLGDYSYTICYTDPEGNSHGVDPTIKNKT